MGIEKLKYKILQKNISFIRNFSLLFIILLFGIFVLSPENLVYSNPYTNIDVVTANNMITNGSYPNLIIFDVRTQSEYDEGHLENSILIPVTELESRIEELSQYKDSEIIVYYRTARRSADASEILDANNFTKVFNMLGGIVAWENANYPIIPEFPSWMILPSILIGAVCLVILRKRMIHNFSN